MINCEYIKFHNLTKLFIFKKKMNIFFNIFVFINYFVLISCNIIIPPTKPSGPDIGFIFVQGAEISAKNYQKFAIQLQNKFDGRLWIALTEFPLNTPEPVLVNSVMSAAYDGMKKNGFDFGQNSSFFFAAHSLGGIIIQDYLIKNFEKLPFHLAGLILEGCFITRSNLNKIPQKFPAILTLGGELDGLARVTRMAESFYHNKNDLSVKESITLVVNGMNHFQFIGDGERTPTIIKNDIEPEISNEEARETITKLINSYINIRIDRPNQKDLTLINQFIESTTELVNPLVDGLNLEGYYHFNPPCSQSKTQNCTQGSEWSRFAQTFMAGLAAGDINVFNSLHPMVSIPEYFPSIANCSKESTCYLNISTYTQNIYATFDALDNGLFPIAASEARNKLKSRQAGMEAFYHKKFDFNKTDSESICSKINQEALNWALKAAPVDTIKRYLSKGKQLVIADDPLSEKTGLQWVFTPLVNIFFSNLD